MEQPAIEFGAVTKRFQGVRGGEVAALDGINLAVAPGEFVVLVGPSGCGKSTLLRLAAGLDAPSSGRVAVRGNPVTGPRRDVAIVFQRPVLLPWRTTLGNMLLPAALRGGDRRQAEERAREHLVRVGLDGFEDAYPAELSGGMQARVAIARALGQEPEILLMDEPFAALDALTREELGADLLRLWERGRGQQTVLFVTHSIPEAILLADRVVAMTPRPGRVAGVIHIDLPRPRPADLLLCEDFTRYTRSVRKMLGHRS